MQPKTFKLTKGRLSLFHHTIDMLISPFNVEKLQQKHVCSHVYIMMV